MTQQHICLICYEQLPHPGSECPHCKGQLSAKVGATTRLLVAVFFTMVVFFIGTGFITKTYRTERGRRAEHHYHQAVSEVRKGNYETAVRHYRDALSYSRDNQEYRLGLAVALYESGQFVEAATQLLDLRATDPTLASVNRLLGRLAAHRGDFTRAVTYYRTAIYGRWPANPTRERIKTQLELVELFEAQGERMQMVAELLDLRQDARDDPNVQRRVGWLFLEAGDPGHANDVFRQLVSVDPKDGESYAGIGEAEFALGHFLTAATNFRRALDLDTQNESIPNRLRLCALINSLDPTYRGITRRECYRRTREIVKRALHLVEQCLKPVDVTFVGPPAPAPEGVAAELERARDLVSGKTRQRRSEEAIEANISLAEVLWNAHEDVCKGSEGGDEALENILRKLSR